MIEERMEELVAGVVATVVAIGAVLRIRNVPTNGGEKRVTQEHRLTKIEEHLDNLSERTAGIGATVEAIQGVQQTILNKLLDRG